MKAPTWLSSLIANPARTLAGLTALCTAVAPLVADFGPGWVKGLHVVTVVATVLTGLIESADGDPDDSAADAPKPPGSAS